MRAETLLTRVTGAGLLLLGVVLYPHALYGTLTMDGVIDPPMHEYLIWVSRTCFGAAVIVVALEWVRVAPLRILALLVGTVIVLELVSLAGLRMFTGHYHLTPDYGAFQYHPALVGLPRPNYGRGDGRARVSHNGWGFRGPAPEGWWRARHRLAMMGGSTTYDVAVADADTWVERVRENLGDGVATLNLGVPGQSTAEHIIMSALIVSEFKPTALIYYIGWNDIANSHVSTLTADYANPHFYAQFGGLQLDWAQFSRSAFLTVAKRMLASARLIESPYGRAVVKGEVREGVDAKLLGLYARNVRTLVSIARSICTEPVLVPQVLNVAALESDRIDTWVPYLRRRDVPPVMRAFNERLVDLGRSTGTVVLDDVLTTPWSTGDFVDSGHFSRDGAAKFGRVVAKELKGQLESMRQRVEECEGRTDNG